jgi:hypothetical protein
MAATVTLDQDGRFVRGARAVRTGTINLGTYAATGIAVAASDFGLSQLKTLQIEPAGGYVFTYNPATSKVLAYQSAGSAAPMGEVGSTDISAAVARFEASGY